LSDFFYVWLRRGLGHIHPELLLNTLTDKDEELIVTNAQKTKCGQDKDELFFKQGMTHALESARAAVQGDGIGVVVYAEGTTAGWEAILGAIIDSKWTVTSSWPIDTEMETRVAAQGQARLASSVHLVCRPRGEGVGVGGWEDILRELPNRIGEWMERLSDEGIRGADLVFSCIGPGLELFTKYERVETAEGREVKLPEFLEKVWEVVGRTALQQVLGTAEARARNGAAGALEEDARLTALFLWTLQSTDGIDRGRSQKSGISKKRKTLKARKRRPRASPRKGIR